MDLPTRPKTREAFEIAVICALPLEVDAVEALFDKFWDDDGDDQYGRCRTDTNSYTTGVIGRHNIVLAHMPSMGNIGSANVATNLLSSFESVKLALVVGICGGVPNGTGDEEIILGDVIISNGVVQYDFGKQLPDRFVTKASIQDSLGRPDLRIRGYLSKLQTQRTRKRLQQRTVHYLSILNQQLLNPPVYPGATEDKLYSPSYRHKHQNLPTCFECANCKHKIDPVCTEALETSCQDLKCDEKRLVPRRRLNKATESQILASQVQPLIHFGMVASGNTVMKSGEHRDEIARTAHVVAFEMESAGVWDIIPSIVIKGVCNYADSHKNAAWQHYAAATAAAGLKAFLEGWNLVAPQSGIGKTQVAIEFVYRVKRISVTHSVFWVSATTAEMFKEGFRQIGEMLQIPGIHEQDADIPTLVKTALGNEEAGKWLMVIDGADDAEILYGDSSGASVLIDYLPFSRFGSILFTTRNIDAAIKQSGAQRVELQRMSSDEAAKLLELNLPEMIVSVDKEDIYELLGLLEHLPLAIMQAAAYLSAKRMTIAKYLQIYRAGDDVLMEVLTKNIEDPRRKRNSSNPVATTWYISFEYIARDDPQAADFLCFMSCINQQNIPVSLLPKASLMNIANSLGTLKAYSLVTERLDGTSYDVHSLVHLAMHNWLRAKKLLGSWLGRAIQRLAEVFPTGEYENRALWTAYLPHALHILASPDIPLGEEAERILLFNVGWCLESNAQYREAEEICRRSLQRNEAALPSNPTHTLKSISKLGQILASRGDYTQAEKLHRRALEVREQILGPEHLETLKSAKDLVHVLRSKGHFKEAYEMNDRALKGMEKALGSQHPDTLTCSSSLAQLLQFQGLFEEAKNLNEQILSSRERILGPKHPDTLVSVNNLALVLQNQGNYQGAENMDRRVLTESEAAFGSRHPYTLIAKNNLAMVMEAQGKYADAVQLLEDVLQGYRSVFGSDHSDTLLTLHNLAYISHAQGKHRVAARLYRHVLGKRQKLFGPEHPDTLNSLNCLARVVRAQGYYAEAEEMYERAVKGRDKVLGSQNPDTLASLHELEQLREGRSKISMASEG